MKIVVISGEDIDKARKRYSQIISGVKKKDWEVVPYSADRLISTGLFTTNILYSIDGIKKLRPEEFKWLTKNVDKYEGSLLIYVEGKLSATIRKALPKSVKIENFEPPQVIWQFLDSFYPGNSKVSLKLFEKLTENEALELVIAMLARHLRDLYWVVDGAKGMSAPSWRQAKLKAQANKFTKAGLVDTIDSLAELDYKSKTSDSDAKLLLEMLIIEKHA